MKENLLRFYLVVNNFSSNLWPQVNSFIRHIESNNLLKPFSSISSEFNLFDIYIDSKPRKNIYDFRKLSFIDSKKPITIEELVKLNIKVSDYYFHDFVVIVRLRNDYIKFKEYLGFFVVLDNHPNLSLGIDINRIMSESYQSELCFSLGQLFANWKYRTRVFEDEIVADHTIYCIWKSTLYDSNKRKITHGAFPTVKKPFNDLRKFSPVIELNEHYFNLLFGKSLKDLEVFYNSPDEHKSLLDNAFELNVYYSKYLSNRSIKTKFNKLNKTKDVNIDTPPNFSENNEIIKSKLNAKPFVHLINFKGKILFPQEYEYLFPVNQPLQKDFSKFTINIINVFIVRYLSFFSLINIDQAKTDLIKKYFSSEPLISIYIFCLLLDRFIQSQPGAKSKGKIYSDYINNIDNQTFINFIDFSLSFSNGIKEIAQNIIHHTPRKKGFLYFVLWEQKDLAREINESTDSCIQNNNYVSAFFNLLRSSYYLDISIFDSNEKGIVDTYNDRYKVIIDFQKFFFGKYSDFPGSSHLDLRYLAHLGLKVFSKIIDFRSGMFIANTSFSNKKEQLIYSPKFVKYFENGIRHETLTINYLDGTNYNFILPIDISLFKITSSFPTTLESDTFIDSFSSFVNTDYSVLNITSSVIPSLPPIVNNTPEERENIVVDFCEKLLGPYNKSKTNDFAVTLNFYDIYSVVSDLNLIIKILAYIKLSQHFRYLIIYNIEEQYLHDFVVTLSVLKDFNLFWNNNHQIYIYNKEMVPLIVAGSTIDEFKSINNSVKKYYGSSQIDIINDLFKNSHHSLTNHSLLPLELFVETTNGETPLSLFEKYVHTLLNSKAISLNPFSLFLKNAHMRLGSKIHLGNFYDAVILFQHSFFVDRFAFLISKEILKNYDRSRQIILIGYGDYSEMLLDRINTIINKTVILDNAQVCALDYIICKDVSDLTFINFDHNIQYDKYYYAIIVPISSTLITNYKIKKAFEDQVNNLVKNEDLKNRFALTNNNLIFNISILLVRDEFMPSDQLTVREKEYYWTFIDNTNKIVRTTYFPDKGVKFLISLNGGWSLPLSCNKCFPLVSSYNESEFSNYTQEQPLMVTNKASVVPVNILSWPLVDASVSTSESNGKRILLLKNSVWYGHFKRNLNHHLFYIDTLSFLQSKSNLVEIKKWLSSIKNEVVSNLLDSFNIIVTITHSTNMSFVNLVNDTIFNGSATILRLDINSDFRNNIIEKYSVLNNIDSNIHFHFVDDAISTGHAISLAKSYVSSIFPSSKTNICVFSSIITIINRSSMYSKHDIVQFQRQIANDPNKNSSFFPFIDLYVPVLRDPKNFCFICKSRDHYKKLSSFSMLDKIKNGYLKKAAKLNVKSTKTNHVDHVSKYNRMLITHKLYEDLSLSIDRGKTLRFLWQSRNNFSDKIDIIKILTTPLFSYYKNIKGEIFSLLLSELNSLLNYYHHDSISFYSLNYLLILMKQLTQLNSNFIIRKYNIERIWKFYHIFYHKYEFLNFYKLNSDGNELFQWLKRFKKLKDEIEEYKNRIANGFFVPAIELKDQQHQLEIITTRIKESFDNKISNSEIDLLINESLDLNDAVIFAKTIDNFLDFFALYAMLIKESISNDLSTSFWVEFLIRTGRELPDSSNITLKDYPFIHHNPLYKLADLDIDEQDHVRDLYRRFYNIVLIENTSIIQQAFSTFEKEPFHKIILSHFKDNLLLSDIRDNNEDFYSKITTEYYYDYFRRFIGSEISLEDIYKIYIMKNYLKLLERGGLNNPVENVLGDLALHFSAFMLADTVFFSFKDIINKSNLYTIGSYTAGDKIPFEINDEYFTHKCIVDSSDNDNYWFEFFSPHPKPDDHEKYNYKEYSEFGAEHVIVIRFFESIFKYDKKKLPDHLGGITFIYKKEKTAAEWAILKFRIRLIFLLKNELVSFLEHNFKNYHFANYIQKQLSLVRNTQLLNLSRHRVEKFPRKMLANLYDENSNEIVIKDPLCIYTISRLIHSNIWFGTVYLMIDSGTDLTSFLGSFPNDNLAILSRIKEHSNYYAYLINNSGYYINNSNSRGTFKLINFDKFNLTNICKISILPLTFDAIIYELLFNSITHSVYAQFNVEIELNLNNKNNYSLIFKNYEVRNPEFTKEIVALLNNRKTPVGYKGIEKYNKEIRQGLYNICVIFDQYYPDITMDFLFDETNNSFNIIMEFIK